MITTSTLTSYQLVTRNLDRSLATVAGQPSIARASERYLERIATITSIDAFIADTETFAFAMKAYGLEDMAYAKAYMRKVLSEGSVDPDAFANKLTDKRFLEFARVFDFAGQGTAATQTAAAQQGTVDAYLRQELEASEGESNEGVQLALYFARKAATVTSAYGILADAALLKVVQTAFGLPAEMSAQDIDRQAATLKSLVDIESFQDPAEVDAFLVRFTALWDATQQTASNPILALFSSQPRTSLGLDLVMTLQALKRGGN